MPFDPALDALLLALREAKLGVGVAETLRLRHWLSLEPALDAERLGRLIACVAVRSKADREVFESIYKAWLDSAQVQARVAPELAPLLPPVLSRPQGAEAPPGEMRPAAGMPGTPASLPQRESKARTFRKVIVAIGIAGAIVAGAAVPRILNWIRGPTQGAGTPDAAASAVLADGSFDAVGNAAEMGLSDAAAAAPDSAAPHAAGRDAEMAPQSPDKPAPVAAATDAGQPRDAMAAETPGGTDAFAGPDSRTYRARVPVFALVPPGPGPMTMPLIVAFSAMLVAAGLWLGFRKRARLSPPEPQPSVPGPPDIVPATWPRLRGPVLLDARDQEAVVWGIGRFVSDQRTGRLDVNGSVRATAAAGGIPALRFHLAGQYRSVWLWVDEGAEDPMPGVSSCDAGSKRCRQSMTRPARTGGISPRSHRRRTTPPPAALRAGSWIQAQWSKS